MNHPSEPSDSRSFLGTGWSFPPAFSVEKNGVAMVSGEEDIRQSLEIILSTGVGERLLRPDFGCDLHSLTFEVLDATRETLLRDLIHTAILHHEPRIVIEEITLTRSPDQNGLILISIDYLVTSTNSRSNLVYPFYASEGTLRA